jgi:hypothetical protein
MEGTGWFFKQDQLPQELNSGRVEREVSKIPNKPLLLTRCAGSRA